VAGTVQVALLLNDPHLYGLAIGLQGEKAGGLAGLRCDVLYKKVSADVGVFRAELELPDSIRRLQLGAVSLTLGILVVEVYTNGDFRVDLGFPHDGDFSRGFTVEVLPFLGRGGIYFGKLSAVTSSRVPAISNGTFSPVIELGVGIAAGVGKEVKSGPLSGGAYVEVIAIFEGVFAWFNPAGGAAATEQYHWVGAMVAIHGKVYGQVELSVLKLSVTVEAYAEASIVMESHRATQFDLLAWVTVDAELTIAFIHVSLSFSARVELSFTVGEDSVAAERGAGQHRAAAAAGQHPAAAWPGAAPEAGAVARRRCGHPAGLGPGTEGLPRFPRQGQAHHAAGADPDRRAAGLVGQRPGQPRPAVPGGPDAARAPRRGGHRPATQLCAPRSAGHRRR
jgi:hypothetical protein